MHNTRFYFHELQIEGITKQQLITTFDKIKEETETLTKGEAKNHPYYVENDESKHHLQITEKSDDEFGTYFFGKLIQTHKTIDFSEEKDGKLLEIELDDDSGICHKEKGLIYFVLFVNKTKNELILMVEDVPFALNIGGIVSYLKDRLKNDNVKTRQKLGRDLVPLINAIGGNRIVLARIRLKKNISTQDIAKLGVVEDAFEKLKEKDLDAELILKWNRGKGRALKEFIKDFLKIENISDLDSVDFGSILRTLSFQIDSEAHPKINLKDDIVKFFPPRRKNYYIEHEEELFRIMKEDFNDKYENEKL